MTDLSELDKMAYEMQELPSGLNMPETYYFLAMRSIYVMFLCGKLTEEQAKREKRKIVSDYNAFELVYRIGEHDMSVLRNIQSRADYYNSSGCPVCKQLANQICGLAVELTDDAVEGGA
ncbi:MAG: hypothetical protein ACI4JQ_02085 [Ruminococcus sp.]